MLVFAATSAAVYWLGLDRPARSGGCSAVATVVQTPPRGRVQNDSDTPGPVDVAAVQREAARQITSEANLRLVLADLARPPGNAPQSDAIAQLRRDLDVRVAESSTPERIEITIGYSGDDPKQAVRLVNRLAEQYAEAQRAAAGATVVEACRRVADEAKAARQKLLVARTNLDGFLKRHFQEHNRRAEALQQQASTHAAGDPSEATPKLVDNPAWIELARQHRELLDRRAELLATRTPQHPLVGDVDRQIAGLARAMAGVPRRIPDAGPPAVVAHPMIGAAPMKPPPDGPAVERPSAVLGRVHPAETAEEHGKAALEYFALKAAMDGAQGTYDRLVEAERGAESRRLGLPGVELRLAQAPEVAAAPGDATRLLLVALASGLAVAAGAGMSFRGVGRNSPLETVAQAQAALPVPIVGMIPGGGGGRERRGRRPDRRAG